MKELVKPLPVESDYGINGVDFLSEIECGRGNARTCNKVCGDGGNNNSMSETEDILF